MEYYFITTKGRRFQKIHGFIPKDDLGKIPDEEIQQVSGPHSDATMRKLMDRWG